jgi:DNA-binding CsgD family transcriptional regulator
LGSWERVADLRYHLGRIAYGAGDLDQAAALIEASLTLAREVADPLSIGQAVTTLGLVRVDRGELARAADLFREGLTTSVELGRKEGLAHCLAGLAVWAGAGRRPAAAARLFGVVAGLREVLGYDLEQPERARYERAEAAARGTLGEEAFAAGFAAGRALRLDDAVAETAALVAAPPETVLPAPSQVSSGLTARELDVLRLLATGRSDREIAAELMISHRTAMTHVSNILGKLGVDSRTAAAARALRDGLL